MARALTTKAVENLKADPLKRVEVPDPALAGLYLIIQPSGVKSWALRYRLAGKPAKLTLGRWPCMGVAEARSAAAGAMELVERGRDPAGNKQAKAEAAAKSERDKFAQVVDRFLRRHASHNKRAADVAAMFRREVMDKWGDRQIQTIAKRDVIDVLDAIVDRGSPVTANRLRAHLNTLFNWAKGRDIVQMNPLDGIRPPAPEKPRDRVLTREEIIWFWEASSVTCSPFCPRSEVSSVQGLVLC